MRTYLTNLAALVLLGAATLAANPVKFDIPAQSAADALLAFSKQANTDVLYSHADLNHVRSQAVSGEWEPDAAIAQLLRDTGFEATRDAGKFVIKLAPAAPGSVSGTLIPSRSGKSLEGVRVTVLETGERVPVSDRGNFKFPGLPPGTYTLVASGEGFSRLRITDVVVRAGIDTILGAQEMPVSRGDNEVQTMTEVVVSAKKDVETLAAVEVSADKVKPYTTGNVDLPRTIDDAKPYYVFSAATIDQSAAVNVEDFLVKRLTMMSTFSSGTKFGGAITGLLNGTVSSVAMRGLGATQTIILMDGRRIAGTGSQDAPDVNSIPLGVIDRIEVLPSSASGIYGGGAVGGVINIITKRSYAGGEVKLTYDNSFDSDSAKKRIDLTYGFTAEGGRTRFMLSLSRATAAFVTIQDREGLIRQNFARATANNPAAFAITGLLGTTPRIESVNNVPLILKSQYGGQSLGAAFVYTPAGYRGVAADGVSSLIQNAGKIDDQWPDTVQSTNGRRYSIYNQPQTRSLRATVRRQMNPFIEAYAEFSNDQNLSSTPGSLIFASTSLSLAATSPTNPFNQAVVVRYPSPYTTYGTSILNRRQLAGGFSIKLPHEWQTLADYSWSDGRTKGLDHSYASAVFNSDLNSGAMDVLADPRLTADTFTRYTGTNPSYASVSTIESSLRAAGPLPKIRSIQSMLAAGVVYRRERKPGTESYSIYPNYPTSNTGTVVPLPGLQEIKSYYSELTVPLVAERTSVPGLRLLELQLTGRRDDYNTALTRRNATTGAVEWFSTPYSSTNPTYGVRYKPVEDVMFRAAFANGFVPPTATQLIPGVPATTPTTIIDPQRGGTSVSLVVKPTGGNPNVTPERSANWSGGVVFTPGFLPGLRLAVDYTWIKKRNNIATLTAQVIVDNEALFPGRVTRGPVPAGSPFSVGPITGIDATATNLYSTATEAYDITLSYHKNTSWGGFAVESMSTYTRSYLQRITLGAPLREYVGVPTGGGPLRLRSNLSLTASYRQWQAGWTATYYSGYTVNFPPFTPPTPAQLTNGGPNVPSQTYHDVFTRYRFGAAEGKGAGWRRVLDRTELQVGIRNVFNKPPVFDGSSALFLSYFGDIRLATYYISVKRGF